MPDDPYDERLSRPPLVHPAGDRQSRTASFPGIIDRKSTVDSAMSRQVNGLLETAKKRAQKNDLAGARSAADEAWDAASGLGGAVADEVERLHNMYERRFHSESVPPRGSTPTVRRAEPLRHGGVTAEELVTALDTIARQPGRRTPAEGRSPDFTDLQRGVPLEGHLIGTLVRDEYGRFGVRDQTTGQTVLVDFPSWGEAWTAKIATADLWKTVDVMGTVHGWKDPARATTMRVGHYAAGAEGGVRNSALSYGLRFHETLAWLAVHPTAPTLPQQRIL